MQPKIPKKRIVLNDLMAFGAEELSDHAKKIAKEIRHGRYEDTGDLSLTIALSHLMDHVVTIWHQSKMTDRENQRQSQEDYERMC